MKTVFACVCLLLVSSLSFAGDFGRVAVRGRRQVVAVRQPRVAVRSHRQVVAVRQPRVAVVRQPRVSFSFGYQPRVAAVQAYAPVVQAPVRVAAPQFYQPQVRFAAPPAVYQPPVVQLGNGFYCR